MLVANSFDLWQKDTFFSAAEEVQGSADIMESAYRTWLKQRRGGIAPQILDELCRELQTALGTAKWQLEEFERAIRLSYRNRADDITATRHSQFVAAIENQISYVEAAFREAFSEEGKQPLRWVNLDKEERDDLAMFLSGTPTSSRSMEDQPTKTGSPIKSSASEIQYADKDSDLTIKVASRRGTSNSPKGFEDVTTSMDANNFVELEGNEIPGTRDDSCCQSDKTIGTRRTWSSPDIGSLKIVIDDADDDDNEQNKSLMIRIGATINEKEPKPPFWKSRFGDNPLAKGGILRYTQLRGINWTNQVFRRIAGNQRQPPAQLFLQRTCSVKVTLALMLTIFLIVPFLIYPT